MNGIGSQAIDLENKKGGEIVICGKKEQNDKFKQALVNAGVSPEKIKIVDD